MSPRASRWNGPGVRPLAWSLAGVAASVEEAPIRRDAPRGPVPVRHEPAPAEAAADFDARAAAERDAFAMGFAQGERAGAEAGMKRADAMLRRLGETLDELAGLRRQILQQSERQLVELALAIARRIVRREIAVDGELLSALARVAIDRLGESASATIRLHPDDFARTAAQVERWAAARVQVVADPSIARGGCFVESPFGFVDASVDAQFQEIARALVGEEQAAGAPVVAG
jgi:flagellar assembly protein FliH